LRSAAAAARAFGRPDAADLLVGLVLDVVADAGTAEQAA